MKKVVSFLVLSTLTSACATTGFQSASGLGMIYHNSTEPVAVTSSPDSSKEGVACTISILGIYSGGDASIDAAKKDGGIAVVSSVDMKTMNVLGIYGRACSIVHGK